MAPINKKPARGSSAPPVISHAPPTAVDPGEAAYQQLHSRLASLPAERIVQPRTDVRVAATFVLSDTAGRLEDASLQAGFASLPAAYFDHSAVEDLIPAAQAALWAQALQTSEEAGDLPIRLSLELADQGVVLRTRMMKPCTYLLQEDPKLKARVDGIRAGTGYVDLAEDLRLLAVLYKEQHELLKQALRYYRAADAEVALELSQRITRELKLLPARAQAARERAWRTWALLQQLYDEVARGGRFLMPEDGEEAFPSLHAIGRAAGRKSSGKSTAGTPPADDDSAPST